MVLGARGADATYVLGAKDASGPGIKSFNKNLAAAGVVGAAAGAALTATAVGATKSSIKMAASFDKGMREVNTLLRLPQAEFKALEKDTLQFTKTMGVSTRKTVPALYQAISAGIPQNNVFDFMQVASKAAIGGVTDLETSVDGLTSVVNAYGRDNITAQRAADLMFTTVRLGKTNFEQLSSSLFNVVPIAAATGIQFEQIAAGMSALTAQGFPTAQATTVLRAAIQSLSAPTVRQSKLMEELGLDFSAARLRQIGLSAAFKEAITATGGNMATLRRLIGSVEGLQGVLALGGEQSAVFEDHLRQMKDAAGSTDAAFEEMEKSTARLWERTMATGERVLVKMGQSLLPTVNDQLGDFSEWFDSNEDAIVSGFEDIATAAGEVSDMITALISSSPVEIAVKVIGEGLGFDTDLPAWLKFAIEGSPIGAPVAAFQGAQSLVQGYQDYQSKGERSKERNRRLYYDVGGPQGALSLGGDYASPGGYYSAGISKAERDAFNLETGRTADLGIGPDLFPELFAQSTATGVDPYADLRARAPREQEAQFYDELGAAGLFPGADKLLGWTEALKAAEAPLDTVIDRTPLLVEAFITAGDGGVAAARQMVIEMDASWAATVSGAEKAGIKITQADRATHDRLFMQQREANEREAEEAREAAEQKAAQEALALQESRALQLAEWFTTSQGVQTILGQMRSGAEVDIKAIEQLARDAFGSTLPEQWQTMIGAMVDAAQKGAEQMAQAMLDSIRERLESAEEAAFVETGSFSTARIRSGNIVEQATKLSETADVPLELALRRIEQILSDQYELSQRVQTDSGSERLGFYLGEAAKLGIELSLREANELGAEGVRQLILTELNDPGVVGAEQALSAIDNLAEVVANVDVAVYVGDRELRDIVVEVIDDAIEDGSLQLQTTA